MLRGTPKNPDFQKSAAKLFAPPLTFPRKSAVFGRVSLPAFFVNIVTARLEVSSSESQKDALKSLFFRGVRTSYGGSVHMNMAAVKSCTFSQTTTPKLSHPPCPNPGSKAVFGPRTVLAFLMDSWREIFS